MNCWHIEGTVEEHHISVQRTARFHTLGVAATARELWIVLHGYGQLARFFLRHFEGLEEGRLIVAPEALSRYYTDEGHSRVGATWMTREDREAEIKDQAAYLDALAETMLASCPLGIPLHVLGFSQGVATACRWVVNARPPVRNLVLWAGTMPLELRGPQLKEGCKHLTVLLAHGQADTIVTAEALGQNEARLREAGITFRTMHFPGGHTLDRYALKQVFGA